MNLNPKPIFRTKRLGRFLLTAVSLFNLVQGVWSAAAQPAMKTELVCPGVWRFTLGAPEKITPVSTRHYSPARNDLERLPLVEACPISVTATVSERGCLVRLPLEPREQIYGLGLQFHSFQQRGLKKKLRVNADAPNDSGDSHAPVPFYVTTRGYGVLVDTARYATFYLGSAKQKPSLQGDPRTSDGRADGWNGLSASEQKGFGHPNDVWVEIPQAAGVDVYVFAGPSLREAVQRYNLFSGGGPLPPRWGLGFWYRCDADFAQTNVLNMASELREARIPCDVLGLEPKWQTHSYSCSFVWSSKFPESRAMIAQLQQQHYRLNLWEHAFTHPSSPIHQALIPHSGDYEVWGGLVPDFLDPQAVKSFSEFQEREHVALGVAGYKLDECDNSDFTGNWSFPEISRFPSGADGEQMHSLFGLRYQDALQGVFEKRRQRTYGLVRSSGALATPYPYVIYSDLYDHRQFVRGVSQAGFSGLLWTPEVREAATPEELIRRLQSVVFSPLAMINAWYLRNPPWKQVNRAENNTGHFADGWENVQAKCREILELRMKFIPILHAAFVRYHREGLPPFRALVMDYPDDPQTYTVDDEYLMGDNLLVAPVIVGGNSRGRGRPEILPATASGGGQSVRQVYLPAGDWYDFWTGARHTGRQQITVSVPLEHIPLFVKAGAVLPLAAPTLSTDDPAGWNLTALVFGDGSRPATLFEDDGSFDPQLPEVQLEWNAASHSGRIKRTGPEQKPSYSVLEWKPMP
jgi:alpha-D-xyloside xylohydrolase